ncbi:MAG: hypothetical protein ACRDQD_22920 [Nocardioidaceae bacterium]
MITMHKPTRSAAERAAELRDDIEEAERQMGIWAGTSQYGMYATRATEARAELEALS